MATGDTTTAFGADPSKAIEYSFRFKVLPLDSIIPSHTDTLEVNPKYPPDLQPRIRSRAASRMQIDDMAKNLNPAVLLRDSGYLDTGAPIIGSDNAVESGNGRVLALRKAVTDNPERYEAYKRLLLKNLDKYGIKDIEGIENPVLVRERLTEVPSRSDFAAEANFGQVMRMSPYEQALQDSKLLSDNVIGTLEVGENQSIDQALQSKANGHIVSHFVGIIPPQERAAVSEAGGGINQQGISRLKFAIFAKTYPGEAGQRLTRIFGENVDPVIKNLENGMMQSLPDMAKAESLIGNGQREKELSISNDLAEVVSAYASVKQAGGTVKDYLRQKEMFGERLNPLQRQILEHLDLLARSPKQTREFIRAIAQRIVEAPGKGQVSMMVQSAPSKEEIIVGIINKQRTESGESVITAAAAVNPRLEEPHSTGTGRTGEVGEGIRSGLAQVASPVPKDGEIKAVVRHKETYGNGKSVYFVEYEYNGERLITGTIDRKGQKSQGWYFGKGVDGLRTANRLVLLDDTEFEKAELDKTYAWELVKRELEGKPPKAKVEKPKKPQVEILKAETKQSKDDLKSEIEDLLKEVHELQGKPTKTRKVMKQKERKAGEKRLTVS